MSIEVFFSYAHEDEELCKKLAKHLSLLKRQGVINTWYDRNINTGNEWEREIDVHLNTAQIILLLVSPDFMASDYCYSIGMKRAMERHEHGEAKVIPIILRPVHWQDAPFGKLQALPTEAKPVIGRNWHSQDEAFFNVAEGIINTIKGFTEALENLPVSTPIIRGRTPPRPALVVGREEDTRELKSRLGITPGGQKQALTIIRGWPGVGKSTLVSTLAYDPDIVHGFPDGVLWTSLGEQANLLDKLAAWVRALGAPNITLNTLEEVMMQLRMLLQNKQMLLLVDDAYKSEDAIPFKQVAGSKCATLITTRFGSIADMLKDTPDDIYILGVLSDEKALELLWRVAPAVVEQHFEKSHTLVADLEGLPLAIRVAGRLLEAEIRRGLNVIELFDKLRASRELLDAVAPDNRFDPTTGTTPTIDLLLRMSTDLLDAKTLKCFTRLAPVAPKPATFDEKLLEAIWRVDNPGDVVNLLVDRGLLEPVNPLINPEKKRYQMHMLLVMHAQSLYESMPRRKGMYDVQRK